MWVGVVYFQFFWASEKGFFGPLFPCHQTAARYKLNQDPIINTLLYSTTSGWLYLINIM